MVTFYVIQRYRCGRREIDSSEKTELGAVMSKGTQHNEKLARQRVDRHFLTDNLQFE